jgi:hypothetical protein
MNASPPAGSGWRIIFEKPILDLAVDPVHPLLGVGCALLVVLDLALELRGTVFRSAQLQRKLVGDFHGAFAVLFGDADCLLQQREHRVARTIDWIALLPVISLRGREWDHFFGGSLVHWQ